MKLKKVDLWFIGIFMLFLISSMSAVTYFNSNGVFDAKITYVNNVKAPYSVILDIENTVGEKLDYDVELIYKRSNFVAGYDYFSCDYNCERRVILKKVFFGDHEVVIRTKYGGKYYEKKINWTITVAAVEY